jgi:hypothetical protein
VRIYLQHGHQHGDASLHPISRYARPSTRETPPPITDRLDMLGALAPFLAQNAYLRAGRSQGLAFSTPT